MSSIIILLFAAVTIMWPLFLHGVRFDKYREDNQDFVHDKQMHETLEAFSEGVLHLAAPSNSTDYGESIASHGNPAGHPASIEAMNTPHELLRSIIRPYCYMDEVFHIPQALQYALFYDLHGYRNASSSLASASRRGAFNLYYWDKMITTPPGGYAPAVALGRSYMYLLYSSLATGGVLTDASLLRDRALLQRIITQLRREASSQSQFHADIVRQLVVPLVTLCRMSNGLLVAVVLQLALCILRYASPEATAIKMWTKALCVALLPTLYFFSLLYYTEPMAVLCILCCLWIYQRLICTTSRRRRLAWMLMAVVGLGAVMVRQTNIIWVGLFPIHYLIDQVLRAITPCEALSSKQRAEQTAECAVSPLRIASLVVRLILSELLPMVMLAALFVAFYYWNEKSVVLGDKAAHVPVRHPAQIAYFFLCVLMFAPCTSLVTLLRFVASAASTRKVFFRSSLIACTLWAIFAGCLLGENAIFHKYLVADNRHYTFTLYRRLLRFETTRVVLVSIVAAAGCLPRIERLIDVAPAQRRNRVVVELLVFAGVLVTCVSQALLEFRYFLIPCVLLLCWSVEVNTTSGKSRKQEARDGGNVHMIKTDKSKLRVAVEAAELWGDVAFLICLNAGSYFVFLCFPFQAPDGSSGRFMW